jgi:two-component system, OmpR family, phosphate regulon sensor histidine kinase PhoR
MWIATSLVLLGLSIAIWLRARRAAEGADRAIRSLRNELETERDEHRASQANAQAHQLAIFNSMVEGILILDAEGRVLTVNRSLERLFGVANELRGKSLMEAFRAHELLELYERVQKEGVVRAYELTLPELNHTRYIEVNAAAIRDAHGDSEGTILIFHDFTRIKELESVRKEFVANVSHELRTPLTLIKGYVETLIDGAKDDPAVAGKFLQTIQKHTNRLTFLIEDLLSLSQLESGQPLMHRQIASLHPIVERVLDELLASAAPKKQTLENLIDPELRANVDGDRVQQVLYNLIDNAIKYGRAGGMVSVGAEVKPEGVQVHVSDDGPGIPPDARERIFERFFRLDRARSREAGGTGLGLSIVKHIVQAHGGRVWVEARPQGGSTFYFTLPETVASARS